jgi:erythromycin esterase-like protein
MVLLQILKSRTDSALAHPLFKGWSDWQMAHRDYILWQNAKQVLENFIDDNSTVAINAHYAHLNKFTYVHFNEVVPLGQYLAEAYGNDYYHLGILLGQGEAGIKKTAKDSLGIQILQDPIKGSLEYLALQTNQDVFFKQGFVKSDKPLMIRRSGNNRSIFQFIPAYSPECMDGFVFIRNSTSYFKE